MKEERWRPVPGYEGLYAVSDQGRVLSVRARRCLRGYASDRAGNGCPTAPYRKVELWKNGERRYVYVHRLVLEVFVGAPPDIDERVDACHRNHDTTDNRLENLRWATHAENMRERNERQRGREERDAIRDEHLLRHCPGNIDGVPF